MTDETSPLTAPDPNGWNRFEKAVDAALHTRLQPKIKAKLESNAIEKEAMLGDGAKSLQDQQD